MQKTITLAVLLLAALSGTLLAQRAVEFEGRYWIPQTHSRIRLDSAGSGTDKLGKYGYFVNSDFGVKIRPVSNVFFTAGYRNFNLNVKNSPDFARVELRGPFVGGGVRF